MRKTVFHEDWWLNAVAPGRWREINVERGGRMLGSLRFVERMMGSRKVCEMPQLTRVLHPVVTSQGGKPEAQLRLTHSVVSELLEGIVDYDHVDLTVDAEATDVAAFIASGCEARVLPNLRLDCRRPVAELWSGLRDKARNVVRRASERLSVAEIVDASAFIAFYLGNLGRDPAYFDIELIRPLHAAAVEHGQGRILAASDEHGVVHAAVFFVWDEDRVYYFLSTRDRAESDLGAVSMLVWSGIELAQSMGRVFDFDGITTDSRFKFMAAFGGESCSRLIISRSTSAYETQKQLRGIARAILKPDWLTGNRPAMTH